MALKMYIKTILIQEQILTHFLKFFMTLFLFNCWRELQYNFQNFSSCRHVISVWSRDKRVFDREINPCLGVR